MKKVLIVASDKAELKGFGDKFYTSVSGVGIALASARSMESAIKCGAEVIVSVGSAGGIGSLERGSVVSFSSVVTPDQDLSAMHLPFGSTIDWTRSTLGAINTYDRRSPYVLMSSSTFSSERNSKIETLKPDAADMEAYGVGISAKILSLPFFAVKIITDIVGDKSTIGDISFSLRESRKKMVEKVEELLALV